MTFRVILFFNLMKKNNKYNKKYNITQIISIKSRNYVNPPQSNVFPNLCIPKPYSWCKIYKTLLNIMVS